MERSTDQSSFTLGIADSARDATSKLWFATPRGFMDVPLAALGPDQGTELDANFDGFVGHLLEAVEEEARERCLEAMLAVRFLARMMRNEGMIGCFLGMHFADDGTSAASVLTVALRDIEWAPPKMTATRAVTLRENSTNVGLLTLPGGLPAGVSETLVQVPGEGARPTQELYQCDLYVPSPSGVQLAILNLSTTCTSSRTYYRQLLEAIAPTVSFTDPTPEIDRAVNGPSAAQNQITSDFG
ncbi:hypothetical protein [Streptomyces sp. V3I7]|uniref:hypothetical protein n=1 Tax=Streptomyces sp. V3I7 TaxID=3042278 RepID=UPI0027886F1E|nr:hypothetical protein [Streptomyces sp. V3I7]MDQ0993959.1 hypothetical protein [Streptomyces sp. V3I7]